MRPGPLGAPKRGVGRLALETGAPVVPVAVIGTEAIRRGWRIRPHKVRIRCGPPAAPSRAWRRRPAARRRGHRPHLAVRDAAVGVARRAAADPPRRGHRRRRVGHRPGVAPCPRRASTSARLPHRRAGRGAARPRREPPAPARRRAARRRPEARAADLDARHRRPRRPGRAGPRAARRRRRPRRPHPPTPRSSSCRRAMVPADGHAAVGVRRRARRRPRRRHPGRPRRTPPTRSRTAPAWWSPRPTARLRARWSPRRSAAPASTPTRPPTSSAPSSPAPPRTPPRSPAAAARGRGRTLAGAAAGKVFAEVDALARTRGGARVETFAGLAGAGDLVATVVAAGSRNRRAGELLGQRREPAARSPGAGPGRRRPRRPAAARLRDARAAASPRPAIGGLAASIAGRVEPRISGSRRHRPAAAADHAA